MGRCSVDSYTSNRCIFSLSIELTVAVYPSNNTIKAMEVDKYLPWNNHTKRPRKGDKLGMRWKTVQEASVGKKFRIKFSRMGILCTNQSDGMCPKIYFTLPPATTRKYMLTKNYSLNEVNLYSMLGLSLIHIWRCRRRLRCRSRWSPYH